VTDYDRAAEYLQRARQIVASLPDMETVQGRILVNLGRVRMLDGHPAAAIQDLSLARDIFTRFKDSNGLADALNNLAQAQLQLGRNDEAGQNLRSAQELYGERDPKGRSSTLHYQGVLAAHRGDSSEALRLLAAALTIRRQRRFLDETAETLYQMAVILRQRGDWQESRRLVSESIAIVEDLCVRFAGEAMRRVYAGGKQTYSEFLIGMLLAEAEKSHDGGLVADALDIAERAHAAAMVDVLAEERFSLRGADPGLLDRRRKVRRQMNFLSNRLAALPISPDSRAKAAIRKELEESISEYQEIESRLQQEYRKYREAAGPRKALSAEAVQHEILSEGDLLLEYWLGTQDSYLWVVSPAAIRAVRLARRGDIEAMCGTLIAQISQVGERLSDPRRAAAFDAFTKDVANVLRLRLSEPPPRRIVVVADGILNRVPFAVLPAGFADRQPRPLGLECEVVQAPSASVFRILNSSPARHSFKPVAVFADPVFNSFDSRVSHASAAPDKTQGTTKLTPRTAARIGFNLDRLTDSMTEIETVNRLVPEPGRWIMSGFDATKPAFLGGRLAGFPLILVSTHAYTDDKQPELSGIVLSAVNREGAAVDGMVRLYDLADLRLNSALVVLSACDTMGRSRRAEALIGLSTGLLHAGASGLLTAPYQVDSAASSAFTEAFLEELLGGKDTSPSSAAMRARQRLAHSKRWHDPFFWGSFVLIGGVN
jgi:CHAT domain-containing protein/tetratricopeptide (TPR) repeat protein